jgi:hypothetical protein
MMILYDVSGVSPENATDVERLELGVVVTPFRVNV